MEIKNIGKISLYVFIGLFGGVLLIFISEWINFTNTNLIPFGGPSWALWFYPVAFAISFVLAGKFMKITNYKVVSLIILIITLVLFFIVSEGGLFYNPIPFGINAVSY